MKFKTDKELPKRPKERKLTEEAHVRKSSTLPQELMVAAPSTDKLEPNRPNPRTEMEEPNAMELNIDSLPPSRADLRTDIDEPNALASQTETREPRRTNERIDIAEAPVNSASNVKDAPTFVRPYTENELPLRTMFRTEHPLPIAQKS
jgi:hypothetical protein